MGEVQETQADDGWKIILAEECSSAGSVRAKGSRTVEAFSHPFLVFQKPDGSVMEEYHASYKTPEGQRYISDTTRTLLELSKNFESKTLNNIMAFLFKASYPRIAMHVETDPICCAYGSPGTAEQAIFSGAKSEFMALRQKFRDSCADINKDAPRYYLLGTPGEAFKNCQRVLKEAMTRAGFSVIPELKMAQTGWSPTQEHFSIV